MYPVRVRMFGVFFGSWELVLLLGLVAGYGTLVYTFRTGPLRQTPRFLLVRYVGTIYLALVGAQLFAYLFDLNTSLVPPRRASWAAYYLNPLLGGKTLYGAIVTMPIAVLLVSAGTGKTRWADAVDHWAPATFVVLAGARVGCFLQGCCYGVRSELFGVHFPEGSILYYDQLRAGLLEDGSAALATIPTQAISAVAILAIASLSLRRLQAGRPHVFAHALAGYSMFRFAIELVRADAVRNHFGPLSSSQWIAVAVLLGYGLWHFGSRGRYVGGRDGRI